MTPLFADWLLRRLDEGWRQGMCEVGGAAVPFASAVINGWYYTRPTPALRDLLPAIVRSRCRLLRFMLNALVRPERDPAGAHRALLDRLYRQWRDDLLSAYRLLAERPAAQDPVRLIDAWVARRLASWSSSRAVAAQAVRTADNASQSSGVRGARGRR